MNIPHTQTRELVKLSKAIRTSELDGRRLTLAERFHQLGKLITAGGVHTLEPMLPLCLSLNGEPYDLKEHFAFSPFYKTQMPSQLVVKSGRQVAKCVRISSTSLVSLENGSLVPGDTLQAGDSILAMGADYRTVSGRVIDTINSGMRQVLRVTTRKGSVVDIAATHPLRKLNTWAPAGDLQVGDRVAALRRGGNFGTGSLTDRVILTAYMIGNGYCLSASGSSFTMSSGPVLDEFVTLANKYETQGVKLNRKEDDSQAWAVRTHADNSLRQWLIDDQLADKLAHQKSLPPWVFDLNYSAAATFISRLWATDGCITVTDNGTPAITYSTASPRLAADIRAMLTKFGIPTSLSVKPAGYKHVISNEFIQCYDSNLIRVETRAGWQLFADTFDVPGKPMVAIPQTCENNNRDTLPHDIQWLITAIASSLPARHGNTLNAAGLRKTLKYPPTYIKAAKYLAHFEQYCGTNPLVQELRNLLNNDITWDEIASIEHIGEHQCWDIEVDTHHNYVLNGLISHNSTNLAAHGVVLSNAIPFFRTLYVTPLYEQIRRFSNNYVSSFINQSPVKALWTGVNTKNSVLSRTFRNNSAMTFSFTGTDCDRVRGISTDCISLDETVRIGTLVSGPDGDRPIETLQPGDRVYAFDESGYCQEDRVATCSDHGVRDCYRIELSNGASIEATNETFIATTAGWKTIATIIADWCADADAVGDNAGRREHEHQKQKSTLLQQSQLQAARIQSGEVPGIMRVYWNTSRKNEERRLRRMVESVGNTNRTSTLAYSVLVPPGGQEGSDTGVAGSANGSLTTGFLADATWYADTSNKCKPATQNVLQEPVPLGASEIVAISWAGKHRVFDISTEKYRTFFAGGVAVHNCQDLDSDHFPIIRETMSHSAWGLMKFTGTPKTLDNTIEGLWRRSSQAEWIIPCTRCHTWNIPALEFHLEDMLGELRDDISNDNPGTVCRKCRKPIRPQDGHWVHRYRERRMDFAGYHIPQIIMPLHYGSYKKWDELLAKQRGWGNYTQARFYNEVLGESVDVGQKLVSETELRNSSELPWANNPNQPSPEVIKRLPHYRMRVLAVDWGGGGESGVSFTTMALLGYAPDGNIHCLWGKRLVASQEHMREAKELLHWTKVFAPDLVVHDYTGAGVVRETILLQAGFDMNRVMPIEYIRAGIGNMLRYIEPNVLHNRGRYRLDKTRSLLWTCQAIKLHMLKFFEYDYVNDDNAGLIHDFLALVEEKNESRLAGDIYTIVRNPMLSDDFAQAVNIGCCALWHANQAWPNFAQAAAVGQITIAGLQAYDNFEWDDRRGESGIYSTP